MNKALRRALAKFIEPPAQPRTCNATPPQPNSRQKCFEFGPDIKDHPSIHAVCSLKRKHPGYHYDEEHGVQWDENTVAWNPDFLKRQEFHAKLAEIPGVITVTIATPNRPRQLQTTIRVVELTEDIRSRIHDIESAFGKKWPDVWINMSVKEVRRENQKT